MSTLTPPTEATRALRLELQELLGVLRARHATAETLIRVYQATQWDNERYQADYIQYLSKLCSGLIGFYQYIVEILDSETQHRQQGERLDFDKYVESIREENTLWDNTWSVMLSGRQFDNDFTASSVKLVHLLEEAKRSEFPNSLAVAQGRGMRRRAAKTPRKVAAARTKAPQRSPVLG
ncbi:MAG: hypothetical protein CMF48_00230 [Legionellales bacterium]|nr:hypothetical protein [Legionellales bacterium]